MPSLPELKAGEGAVVEVGGETLAVFNDGGTVRAASAACTHRGCIVAWNGEDKTFDCPCHGSRFNGDFTVRQGPAALPLDPHEIRP